MPFRTLLLFLTLCSSTAAQTVYKCVDANGAPGFSQRPCDADPARVTTMSIKPVGREDPAATARVADLSRVQLLNAAQRECVERGATGHVDSSNARIRGHEQRIAQLEARASRARNNLAGATWESGMRQEIAALRTAISDEHHSRASLVASVQGRCAQERLHADRKVP